MGHSSERRAALSRESLVMAMAYGTSAVMNNISGVTDAAAHTGGSATRVLTSATDLEQQSQRLRDAMAAFLVTVRAA